VKFKTCNSFWKKNLNIFENNIQHLYNSTNNLASLKQTEHDMMSIMSEAQFTVEELKMFLEV